jgi:uncharacterized membrane protein
VTGYSQLLALHVLAGGVALACGAGALAFRKGSKWHRYCGRGFVGSMAVMLGSAVPLSIYLERYSGVVGIVLFLYLATSAWQTIRSREAGRIERAMLPIPVVCAMLLFFFGIKAWNQPTGTLPPVGMIFFLGFLDSWILGFLASLAALGDALYLRRKTLKRTTRLSRHVWRMSMAFFAATGSFFMGQAKFLPISLQKPVLLMALAVAPLLFMGYWLVRVRFKSENVTPKKEHVLPEGVQSSNVS